MKPKILHLVIPIAAMVASMSYSSIAGGQAPLVRATAKAAFEKMLGLIGRNLGHEAAEQLTEKVGREGAEQIFERALQEGGEEAVERVVRIGGSHGAQALRVLKSSPAVLSKHLDELSESEVKAALNALERDSDLSRLTMQYGANALRAEVAHPGVGGKVIKALGNEGVLLSKSLNTDQMLQIARRLEEIAQLPASARSELVSQLQRAPARVIETLEKSPRVLTALTVLGITAPTAHVAADNMTQGTTTVAAPDGTMTSKSGPLAGIGKSLGAGLWWLPFSISFALAAVIVFWGVNRFGRQGKNAQAPRVGRK